MRRVNLGFFSSASWDWNGRNGGGALVRSGAIASLSRRVSRVSCAGRLVRSSSHAAGGTVRLEVFLRRRGPGGVEVRGNCYVAFDYFQDGDIFLDCWGGTFAGASWVFRVPATTFRISKSIRGTVMCCAPGDWASVGVRRNARTYVVAAGVSGWRAWQIRSVAISYAYRQRI